MEYKDLLEYSLYFLLALLAFVAYISAKGYATNIERMKREREKDESLEATKGPLDK